MKFMNHEDYKSYDDLPLMLSVKELGAVLGISRTSAYELVHTKEIPSVKAGRGRRTQIRFLADLHCLTTKILWILVPVFAPCT